MRATITAHPALAALALIATLVATTGATRDPLLPDPSPITLRD